MTSHLSELDGLRGYLAILVFSAHYRDSFFQNDALAAFFSPMPIAVPTFALLSGFVLYRSFQKIDAETMRKFLIRRVLRIYPTYVLCFVMTIVGIAILESPKFIAVNWLRILSDLFMLDLLQYGWRIESPTWSLFPELAYSFVLPIFVLVFGPRSFALNVCIYILLVFYSGSSGIYLAMFRFFWLGMIILQIYERKYIETALRKLPKAAVDFLFSASFFGGLLYIAAAIDLPGDAARALDIEKIYHWLGFQGAINLDIGCILFFLGVLYSRPIKAFLNTRVLQFLGLISYSVYLVHYPLALIASPSSFNIDTGVYKYTIQYFGDQGLSFFILYMPAVLFVATLSFIFVERIGMAWGIKLSTRIDPAPASPTRASSGPTA